MSTMGIAASPVFVDATGRRVKTARVAVRALTALLLILVAATVLSLVGGVPLPGLTRPAPPPAGESLRPQRGTAGEGSTTAPVPRSDVSQPPQAAVDPGNRSPVTVGRDAATAVPSAAPKPPTPRPAEQARTESSGPATPATATVSPTPTSTPHKPSVRPTPANRPVQPPGQSGGNHGTKDQHGPPAGRGPQR